MSQAFVVTSKEAGQTLAAVLKGRLGMSWSRVRRLVELRQVRVGGQGCAVRSGACVRDSIEIVPTRDTRRDIRDKRKPGRRPVSRAPRPVPSSSESIPVLRHVDDAVVVVEKPPGVTTHRSGNEAAEFGQRGEHFLPSTLADRLPALLPGGGPILAVHRIDRDTSGLVVFAATAEAEAALGKQFRAHTIGRRYLAITRGRPSDGRIESWLIRDRGDGRRGSGPPGEGQRAVTHVRVLEIRTVLPGRMPARNGSNSSGSHPSRRSRRAPWLASASTIGRSMVRRHQT